ncbi:MAG: magnesium/cobalt transporter CorA [Phaeodactylibacter sp.]|nr:magnesium/cobalt transporter CorA [Phaeodactylibacter sp.]MCB9291091.1 magnesium/cobalt transporter CorA [Lewinellaceae bacterium]
MMKFRKAKLPAVRLPKRQRKTGLPPGTLIFTGHKKAEQTLVTLVQFNPEGQIFEQHVKDELPAPEEGALVSWYDIRGLHNVELIQAIGEKFNIHPLVLEDVLDTQQRPKFEEHEGGIFLTVQYLFFDKIEWEIKTEQVAIFAGNGFVISFQEDEDDLFPAIRERIQSGRGKIKKRGPDYLAYALIDNIVDHYYLLLDQIEEVLDTLEEEILSNPDSKSKQKIHDLKLQSILLRKMVSPLREAISRFSRSDNPIIAEDTGIFIRDLYDHTIQVMDTIETYRDVMSGLYDLYLSEISFKMNNVIQLLTIISTIFIPLTFLAGIYGMNFKYMPELQWRYGYFGLWGIMLLLSVVLILLFKRKHWL